MRKSSFLLFCMVFIVAFSLRYYNCTYPPTKFMDENFHITAANHYWETGQFEPDMWEHPPLRPIILYGFLQVFGDNPTGWRMRNILFGTLTAALTYLFALRTTGSRKTAVMAALILATDPLHIVVSRFSFCEANGVFFLAAVVVYLWHKQRCSWLMLSAFLVGCAMATKWYFIPCWFLLYLLALHENNNYRNIKTALFISCTYLFIPVMVYVLSFYLWFGRGYAFSEFIEFVINVYASLQQYSATGYMAGLVFLTHISAAEWFTLPIVLGQGTYLARGEGEFVLFTNNLPIWGFTIPCLLGSLFMAIRQRCMKTAIPALFFCGSYILFVFVKRPAFLYSAVPMLPFAFTLIAFGITQIAERYSIRIYAVALAAILGWNMYLYPLVTSKRIPVDRYRYLLDSKDIQTRKGPSRLPTSDPSGIF